MKTILTSLLFLCLTSLGAIAAETKSPTPAKQQFLYILRLVPRLHDDKAWTPADNAIIGRHFNRLKEATERGQVILAGRTNEPGDKALGLVIFEAANEAEAREFMNADPVVAEKIMTAELRPYAVALRAK